MQVIHILIYTTGTESHQQNKLRFGVVFENYFCGIWGPLSQKDLHFFVKKEVMSDSPEK
jgi:hypothetical protein